MGAAPDNLRLVWIDLEMTGLNAERDHILEIAAVVTGPDLVPLVEVERVLSQPDDVLEAMSARVRRIHTENGLLADVATRGVFRKDAERDVLAAIARHVPPGEGIMCGSSIDHDRRFIAKFLPRLDQHLHFRQVDIGTISVLVNSWYPDVEYPHQPSNHRAMGDVRAALDELRFYCKHAFRVDLGALARARVT